MAAGLNTGKLSGHSGSEKKEQRAWVAGRPQARTEASGFGSGR